MSLPAPPLPPLPIHKKVSKAFNDFEQSQLTSSQVKRLKKHNLKNSEASMSPYVNMPKPVTRTLIIDLSPGVNAPILRLSAGSLTSIVFSGLNGDPWYIDNVKLNRSMFSDGANSGDTNPSNVLTLEPLRPIAQGNVIFKAGDILYATLITQVDTDDSTSVLATVYGGAYDQATLIGQVNISSSNINIQFNQLSPKDRTKKSIAIKAIAIREQDAKQGVAEKIDNHTLERYSYLFAASMLKAVGKAAEGAVQTTIGLGGAIVQSQEKVTDNKEIAKQGLGEVGTTMGNEARRKFNRPPTYTIPANQGIGIIFTQDVEG
jgi:hypothetical protein